MVEIHGMKTSPLSSPGGEERGAIYPLDTCSRQSSPIRDTSKEIPNQIIPSDGIPFSSTPDSSLHHSALGDLPVNMSLGKSEDTLSQEPHAHAQDHERNMYIVDDQQIQKQVKIAEMPAIQGQQQSVQFSTHGHQPQKVSKPVFPDDVARRIRIPNNTMPVTSSSGTGPLSFTNSVGTDTDSRSNMYMKSRLPTENSKRRPSFRFVDGFQPFVVKDHIPPGSFIPQDSRPLADNQNYPTPNLYDLTLKLGADPGLEAWFSNLVDILREHYGVERVSISVPGDMTDLENVPWGQKAVFNQDACYLDDSLHFQGSHEEAGGNAHGITDTTATASTKRPSLFSRHSFAGFGSSPLRDSPQLQNVARAKRTHAHICAAEFSDTEAARQTQDSRSRKNHKSHDRSSSEDNSDVVCQAVFPVPRPLEVEPDPLIKRIGVVKLFGRTKPIVLTREYSQDTSVHPRFPRNETAETTNNRMQMAPGEIIAPEQMPSLIPRSVRSRSVSSISMDATQQLQNESVVSQEGYEEYEQVPPSPWAQSPAPSPAPRVQAEVNPFFTSHTVDERAFSRNPPAHDYSRLESLEAIGVDRAKSVVHIPLVHSAGASKEMTPQTLRFPIAILSILSPIVPYPANLRESLSYFMPHLTTSFSLAQHYSQLERQVSSQAESSRSGQLLGLGGTFSSENSGLEFVAGLSGHVNNTLANDAVEFSSPGEKSSMSAKFSPTLSLFNTPGYPDNNFTGTPGNLFFSPAAATKHGNDAVDSYFNVKRSRSLRESAGSSYSRAARMRRNMVASVPSSPGNQGADPIDEVMLQDPDPTVVQSTQDSGTATSMSTPPHYAPRPPMSSAASVYSQLHRELHQRPFPDTIAQLMLNSVPLHLFLAKPHSGEVIWTNAKFDAYRRRQQHEQRSMDPWQNIHWSEQVSISQKWLNALRTGSQFTERVRVKRFKDESSYRWFIFRANPLLSTTGEVLYWIGSFLDVHEQHMAELKAVKEKEKFAINAKYQAFSNSIPQVVFEAAEYRGLIFANDQWRLYSGQPVVEALSLGFARHVHPDDLGKCTLFPLSSAESADAALSKPETSDVAGQDSHPITTAVDFPLRQVPHGVTPALSELLKRGVFSLEKDENGRVFYSTEIRLRSKGGDYRWHLVRVVKAETISFGDGEASWYGTCTDINDRKLLEKELNKAMQQLNTEMESKTKFFSNMSHEIRTPLNGILGTIPFILDTNLDTDQRRMLDTIQNSSTNLRELVDNILDVSRVEAGKMSLVNSWFHVRSVIEDVIDTISSRALDKGLEINYLMDAEVPSMIIGDRFRIRQVLINLVGNAVKFTSKGEIYTYCSIIHDPSIKLGPTQMLLNFDVVDTGKGFSPGDSERLMQRFSQLGANGSQQHAGSGLGLFLSKQLVEMHGGKLTPSGEEGRGARFSFYVVVDLPPTPTLPSQPPKASVPQHRQSLPPLPMPFPTEMRDSPKDTAQGSHDMTKQGLESQSNVQGVQSAEPVSRGPATAANDSVKEGHDKSETPAGDAPPQGPFSILILAPLDHTREAIKQHITQVVPHDIQFSITSLADVEDWKDSVNGENDTYSHITHLVVNLPAEDVLDVMQYIGWCEPSQAPSLVVIADLYQKRHIQSRIAELTSRGNRIYTVPKPLKPSTFSPIFDPFNCRELSKDHNQDMAREMNDNFKTVAKMVKAVVGNKGHRILLVEDDETNRQVC